MNSLNTCHACNGPYNKFIIDQINSGPGQKPEIVNWAQHQLESLAIVGARELIDLQYSPKHKSIDNIGRMVNLVPPSICLHWSCGWELNVYH